MKKPDNFTLSTLSIGTRYSKSSFLEDSIALPPLLYFFLTVIDNDGFISECVLLGRFNSHPFCSREFPLKTKQLSHIPTAKRTTHPLRKITFLYQFKCFLDIISSKVY